MIESHLQGISIFLLLGRVEACRSYAARRITVRSARTKDWYEGELAREMFKRVASRSIEQRL